MKKTPITRFAPSPTGYLHVGNVRTALINWLFSRSLNGSFILRLDDTDKERSKKTYAQEIQKHLEWLGLKWDSCFTQSSRENLYRTAIEKLKSLERLYPCYETPEELDFKRRQQLAKGAPPKYDRSSLFLSEKQKNIYRKEGRVPHWRFKLDEKDILWDDMIRGPLSFKAQSLSDPILVKPDGQVVYTLATVVDDIDKKISHLIRGEDHISNTAVQIQLTQALSNSFEDITYGHLPLITERNGEVLSKSLGSQSLKDLISEDIDPMAIVSLLATIGTPDPIILHNSLDSLIKSFDIRKFSKSSAKFDDIELKRLNTEALQRCSLDVINDKLGTIESPPLNASQWDLISMNISSLQDIRDWQIILTQELPETPSWSFPDMQKNLLDTALKTLPGEPFNEETWKDWISLIKEKTGLKGRNLIMPIRLALTDKEHGPEMKQLIVTLGRNCIEKRLKRLDKIKC